jgi:flagellar M-ring protein FliF
MGTGLVFIAMMMAALAYWAYRPDYQVLFADLAERDAAAMTADLDKSKTPYQLADGGKTILVPKDLVYKSRLALMGGDVPLHGAVGFEVFNNADFGMTEFVQKVNYQRAIQGELTRTILAIDDVQAARVHLAIPEQGLFKKGAAKSKASVTLTIKPGHSLTAEQVAGIQRLIAASVADIVAADVTVLDQRGVALTRASQAESGIEGASSQLDAKRAAEDYLGKKVAQVLDRSFGPGQAVASVDVLLNMDQSKVTTEEVLPARSGAAATNQTGVTVRERISSRDPAAGGKGVASEGTNTSETEYQVGRRVEQVAVAAGALRRMTIAVLVKQPLDEAEIAKMKEVVGLAVGFSEQRGDAIVVYPMSKLIENDPAATPPAVAATGLADAQPVRAAKAGEGSLSRNAQLSWILAGLLALACAGATVFVRRNRRITAARPRLDAAQRAQLLGEVKAWIASADERATARANP